MSRKSWFLVGVGTGHLFLLAVGIELWGGLDHVFSERADSAVRGGGLAAGLFFFWSLLKFRSFRVEQVVMASAAAVASLSVMQHHLADSGPEVTFEMGRTEAQNGPIIAESPH